jgi:hypothetical protein
MVKDTSEIRHSVRNSMEILNSFLGDQLQTAKAMFDQELFSCDKFSVKYEDDGVFVELLGDNPEAGIYYYSYQRQCILVIFIEASTNTARQAELTVSLESIRLLQRIINVIKTKSQLE